jgi:hypothetical protein
MSMCHALQAILEPRLSSRGFAVTESAASSGRSKHGIHQLEFRARVQERTVLLSICELTADRTVTAELWSQEGLRRSAHAASADAVAIRRRTWAYGAGPDGQELRHEIAGLVTSWIESLRAERSLAGRTAE